MSDNIKLSGIFYVGAVLLAAACIQKPKNHSTHFTKADSVTETYLNLKDKMFETWNLMMRDDNQKIRAMRNLVHELGVTNHALHEDLKVYEQRINELAESRYTHESMDNLNVIEEYDFASNALVSELVSRAEAQPEFAYNTTLQRLVETIRTADQRVNNYRIEYDRLAAEYNEFIDGNVESLREVENDSSVEKSPLFQMVADD